MDVDVAIVGGGPAGCATGLSLRSHAPGLSAAVVEASDYGGLRIGETLPPPSRRLLEHLGVWETFRKQGHREVYGTAAAWGGAAPQENDFVFNTWGVGWHLDRAAFDAMLAEEAERRGVIVLRDTRLLASERIDGWRLSLSNGKELRARFVVDATGSAAAFARRQGARFAASDRLASFARFFEDEDGDPGTLVEAFEGGWWYTAGLPGGVRIAACLTDVDLARGMDLYEIGPWERRLGATDHIRRRLGGAGGPVIVRATPSRRLDTPAGPDWLAVGDAASVFDPLSSQGILKGLRSGVFASYAVGDLLAKGDGRGMERYGRFVREEFDGYLRARSRYYASERRWPESEFWKRRGSENLLSGGKRSIPA